MNDVSQIHWTMESAFRHKVGLRTRSWVTLWELLSQPGLLGTEGQEAWIPFLVPRRQALLQLGSWRPPAKPSLSLLCLQLPSETLALVLPC